MERCQRVSRWWVGKLLGTAIALSLLLLPLASCSPTEPVQFKTLTLGIPADAMNSPVTGQLPDDTKLHVAITFKVSPNLLKEADQRKDEPGKPSHLDDFAKKIGIDDGVYQKIKDFFNPQGITLKLSKLRTHLTIDAKASTIAKVLQTRFVVHKYNDRTFYAPDGAKQPQVPSFLFNTIDAITGLDNYSSRPQHLGALNFTAPTGSQRPTQDCSPIENTLLPREVAGAYGFEQFWNRGYHGENMTVNLVEIDGFYRQDVQNYFDCINFKGKLSVSNVDGAPQEALGESTLDIQMIAGLARSINMVVYQTDASNPDSDVWAQINDELQQIINDNTSNANNGNVVSISLGAAEGEITPEDIRAIDSSIQQLTRVLHMTVFIASGDCGAFTSRVYGKLAVAFPASDPWAASVGGTIMQVTNNRARANEIVWSDNSNRSRCTNQWGSGGGNSVVFQRPDWQNGAGVNNQYSKNARQVPDISAVAYALAVYFKGRWGSVGGTSAAAPIWATGMALVNQAMAKEHQKIVYSPQVFYQVAARSSGAKPYFDVIKGNNLYFPATAGWDYSTGLGTPNLGDFYNVVSKL